jgi:hypothetical protein
MLYVNSLWMPSKTRLNPAVHDRIKNYVDHIYQEGIGYDSNVQKRNYDLLIVTPGNTIYYFMI